MRNRKVAEKYAQALFDLAVEGDKVKKIAAEFAELTQLVEENEELNQVLEHPELNQKEKKQILEDVFKDQLSEMLLNFLRLLIDKKREVLFSSIYQAFKELVAKKEDRLEIKVEAPVELSSEQKNKLESKLSNILNKKIELVVDVKPELLGGLVLKAKNKILDGSLLKQLQNLEYKLKNSEVS